VLKIVKITLSLWDVAGQERFDLFKTDFFHGTAAVGLVFDLSRPDTFERIDEYFNEIRDRSGNIPIILVGNKNDLREEIGETISREEIIKKVNQYNLFEYIETSAKLGVKVDELFNRLSITALLDLRPRLGEIVNEKHFRFKVLLVGAAAVGKSSLIKTFVKKEFNEDYKLTIGLDFMTRDFEIPDEDLPKEVHEIIQTAISKYRKPKEPLIKEEIADKVKVKENTSKKQVAINNKYIVEKDLSVKTKIFTHNYIFLMLLIIGMIIVLTTLIHFIP